MQPHDSSCNVNAGSHLAITKSLLLELEVLQLDLDSQVAAGPSCWTGIILIPQGPEQKREHQKHPLEEREIKLFDA